MLQKQCARSSTHECTGFFKRTFQTCSGAFRPTPDIRGAHVPQARIQDKSNRGGGGGHDIWKSRRHVISTRLTNTWQVKSYITDGAPEYPVQYHKLKVQYCFLFFLLSDINMSFQVFSYSYCSEQFLFQSETKHHPGGGGLNPLAKILIFGQVVILWNNLCGEHVFELLSTHAPQVTLHWSWTFECLWSKYKTNQRLLLYNHDYMRASILLGIFQNKCKLLCGVISVFHALSKYI